MLEDQSEERACLYALGMLDDAESAAFEADAARDEKLRRTAADLEETLANLALTVTPMRAPGPDARRSLLERITGEPARVTTDAEGHIQSINPAFTALCGYELAELRGRKPGHILQGPDTDPATIEALRRAISAGTPCEVEMVNYHKDGSRYRVRISVEPRHDEAGTLVGFSAAERKLA